MKLFSVGLGLIAFLAMSLVVTPPAMAEDLDEIKAAGEIRMAMTGAYPPFNFVNTKNEVVGFDPTLGKEIASRLEVKPVIVTTAWDGIIAGLLSNRYDIIMASMTITDERSEVVDFVGPYYRTSRAVFAMEGSSISSVNEITSETVVGVGLGETHEQWAREQGYKVRTYKGMPEMLIELEAGRVDVIVADLISGSLAAREGGQSVKVLADLVTGVENIGIAIRKGNPKLKSAMEAALAEIQNDGTYKNISMEWIGRDIR